MSQKSSLIDQYPKEHLFLHLIKERRFRKVAEIGVDRGMLAERVLSNAVMEAYYAVDPWKVYIESYDRKPHEKECQQSFWDSLYERVMGMMGKFPRLNVMRMTSVSAAKIFMEKEEKLDAAYIDAIHDEENIVKDIYCWLPLIRNGGVLSGHDYIKRYTPMCRALDRIFGDQLNLMVIDPSKPAISFRNTHQGGNWWVEVRSDYWKLDVISKLREIFPEYIAMVEEEWKQ